jgi:hypothetical protein
MNAKTVLVLGILALPNPELTPPGIQVVLDWIRELQDKLSRSP